MPGDVMSQWYIFVLFGLFSGFASALMGIGGGVVLMPLLLMVAMFDPSHARGTALGYMVGTCLVGALTYQYSTGVNLNIWVILLLTAGGIVGAFVGAKAGHRMDAVWVKRIFAMVMVLAAARMFWGTLGREAGTIGKPPGATERASTGAP